MKKLKIVVSENKYNMDRRVSIYDNISNLTASYSNGDNAKNISLSSKPEKTYSAIELSCKSEYIACGKKHTMSSLGDKITEKVFGNKTIAYRGKDAIYMYDNSTKDIIWVHDTLDDSYNHFDFDSDVYTEAHGHYEYKRSPDGSIIQIKSYNHNDRMHCTDYTVKKLKDIHSKYQAMFDVLITHDINNFFGTDYNNDGIRFVSAMINKIMYHSCKRGGDFRATRVIDRHTKKVSNNFLYDKDMIVLGVDDSSYRYDGGRCIYFMNDIKDIENETFANRLVNYNKYAIHYIITENSMSAYNSDMEKLFCIEIGANPVLKMKVFNVSHLMHNTGRVLGLDNKKWLSIEVVANDADLEDAKAIVFNVDGTSEEMKNIKAYIEPNHNIYKSDMKNRIKLAFSLKDNCEIKFNYCGFDNIDKVTAHGVVDITLSPNMTVSKYFNVEYHMSTETFIKKEVDNDKKQQLTFHCDVDGDMLAVLQNNLVYKSNTTLDELFKSVVKTIVESVDVNDIANPNLTAIKIYNKFVDIYNEEEEEESMSDEDIFRYELKRFMNKEIKEIEVNIEYLKARAILHENGFSVKDRDCEDRDWQWDTNGWQNDYWTFAIKDGERYNISGGTYYGDFSMIRTEDDDK